MKITGFRILLIGMSMGLGLAIWNVCAPHKVIAIEDPENFTAVFGIARGQTARLNVLNSGEERGYIINWKFLDAMGRVVIAGQREFIPTEQVKSFDLSTEALGLVGDTFGRTELRAVVRALGGPDTRNLHISVEVFNNSDGKTSFIVANSPPEPD